MCHDKTGFLQEKFEPETKVVPPPGTSHIWEYLVTMLCFDVFMVTIVFIEVVYI